MISKQTNARRKGLSFWVFFWPDGLVKAFRRRTMWKIMSLVCFFLLAGMIPTFGQSIKNYPGLEWSERDPEEVMINTAKLQEFIKYVCKRDTTRIDSTAIFISRFGFKINPGEFELVPGDHDSEFISKESENRDVASACKPTFAHFFFKAIEEGKINLDDKVATLTWPISLSPKPSWNPGDLVNLNSSQKDKNITWYHLANQISCFGVKENPGTHFCYSDYQIALFWDLLFQGVYGKNVLNNNENNVDNKVLLPFFKGQLNCQDNPSYLSAYYNPNWELTKPIGRLRISVRDFARFGLLYMYRGRWKKLDGTYEQLISEYWVNQAATTTLPNTLLRSNYHNSVTDSNKNWCCDLSIPPWSTCSLSIPDELNVKVIDCARSLGTPTLYARDITDHKGSYGWLWWKNGEDENGKRFLPNVPHNTFACLGHGGEDAMIVIPEMDIVVAWHQSVISCENNHYSNEEYTVAKALQLLLAAIQDISITSPQGGVNWETGTTHSITWNTNSSGNLNIWLLKNGQSDELIASGITASSGSYSWAIPGSHLQSSGYKIKIETADGKISAQSNIFSIIAPLPTYNIIATAGANGTISPASATVTQGNSQIFTINPSSGYGVLKVTVDNANDVTAWVKTHGNQYTFSDVHANHTIAATFTQIGVSIISPNGGENWEFNTVKNITWNAPGITGNIQLSLYRNGKVIGWIANCAAYKGTYDWKVGTNDENTPMPVPSGNGYSIKINSWGGTYVDTSNAPFSIYRSSGSLTLTAPNGGENWQFNTYQNITWSAPGVTGNVFITLYRNGAKIGWIANCAASACTYSWKVGTYEDIQTPVPVGGGYAIEIKSWDGNFIDESNGYFNIVNPSVYITLTAPNGGESWQRNTYKNITWNSQGITGNVMIVLYRNGAQVAWLANWAAYKGTFDWRVGFNDEDLDLDLPAGGGYSIFIKSWNGVYTDVSDGTFSLY